MRPSTILSALGLGVFLGCTDLSTADKTACRTQADCLSGYICVEQECVSRSFDEGGSSGGASDGGASHSTGGAGETGGVGSGGAGETGGAGSGGAGSGGAGETGGLAGSSNGSGGADGQDSGGGGSTGGSSAGGDGGSSKGGGGDGGGPEGGTLEPCPVIFVDEASGAAKPDGTSWAKAFRELVPALADAEARLEAARCAPIDVWIAKGTYTPGAVGERSHSFQLKSGFHLYGGFAGTEATLAARDIGTNVTTLSGDLKRDDRSGGSRIDNAYHVVVGSFADETAILDGLTIESAYADGAFPDNLGGGLYLKSSHARLRNLIVRGSHAAADGGGVYIERGAPELTHVDFPYGDADRYGGGLFVKDATVTCTDVTFTGGRAQRGGGFYAENAVMTVAGASFESNFVAGEVGLWTDASSAGAGFFASGGTVRMTDAWFHGNVAYGSTTPAAGGAIAGRDGATLRIAKASFDTNRASINTSTQHSWDADGGAISVIGGVLAVTNASFSNCSAQASSSLVGSHGGAVYADATDVIIANSSFMSNAAAEGAALFIRRAPATALLVNATVIMKLGPPGTTVTGPASIANSVFWGTQPPFANVASVTYSCVENGGYDETQPGETNRDDCVAGGNGLAAGSPGIDQADATLLPKDTDDLDGDGDLTEPLPLDLLDQPRHVGAGLDMGANESQP